MDKEVEIDGVVYVDIGIEHSNNFIGDPSSFWKLIDEKDKATVKRKLLEHLIEAGWFVRKDDYEKEHSIYKKDELFYGL